VSALRWAATTAEVGLSAGVAKTVLQIVAAANHRVRVERWGVFFDGVSVTAEPVQVRVLRQTTAGTMSANTPKKLDDSIADSVLTTAQDNATVEPTAGDVLDVVEVHPQNGYEIIFPPGQEIIVGGGDRLGIECTAPAAVNVRAKIVAEE
jgi:hypothetical protein